MHGQSVVMQQVQVASLVAAVLIHLQQLPPQLLLNLHLHQCVMLAYLKKQQQLGKHLIDVANAEGIVNLQRMVNEIKLM